MLLLFGMWQQHMAALLATAAFDVPHRLPDEAEKNKLKIHTQSNGNLLEGVGALEIQGAGKRRT